MRTSISKYWILGIAFGLLRCGVLAQDAAPITVEQCVAILEERTSQASARLVRFDEARVFPFRSRPIELEGVARIQDGLGVSIEYPSKKAAIIVDDAGMVLRRFKRDGESQDRQIDARQAEFAELIAAAISFDKERLLNLFDLEASGDAEQWTLSLLPKEGMDEKITKISIRSDADQVESISIDLKGEREARISVVEEAELSSFSEEDLAKYFRRQE